MTSTKRRLKGLLAQFTDNKEIQKHYEELINKKDSTKGSDDAVKKHFKILEDTLKNRYQKGKIKIYEQFSSLHDNDFYQKILPRKLKLNFSLFLLPFN